MPSLPNIVPADDRAEIENLIHEHVWRIDHHASETLADLYTENGKLHGIRLNQTGREEINAYGRDKVKALDVTARHIISNLRLLPLEDGRIRGTMCIALHRSKDAVGSPLPVALADATDTYIRGTDGRWRIEERFLELIYESADH